MEKLIIHLKERNLTISTIESFTGGLFASELSSVAGASQVFVGSLVAYDTKVKIDKLEIDATWLEEVGVISEACAIKLAQNGLDYFKSDICISFTGNAGPKVMEDKAVGLWYGAIATKDKLISFMGMSNLSRNKMRSEAIHIMKERIQKEILG